MHFVHSLCRVRDAAGDGWFTPVELGEVAPQHVSFVVPVATGRRFFDRYVCELADVRLTPPQRRPLRHELHLDNNALVLSIGEQVVWFVHAPGTEQSKPLRYHGTLTHADFALPLLEVEPHDPGALDALLADQGLFILGCDPFTHYEGLHRLVTGNRR